MKLLMKIEGIFVISLLAILVAFTFTNVLLRYFFDYSILGSIEISILIFAWIVFIGSSMAISTNEHIRINLLESILNKKANKILSNILSVIILILCIYLCILGFSFTFKVFGETLGATNIPKVAVYFAFPIGFALSSIHLIHQLFDKSHVKADE